MTSATIIHPAVHAAPNHAAAYMWSARPTITYSTPTADHPKHTCNAWIRRRHAPIESSSVVTPRTLPPP